MIEPQHQPPLAPAADIQVGTGPHQPALDGIRGIAILMVILFHAGHFGNFRPVTRLGMYANMLISSGWIGVDLFFVLSGFLITGILLRSRQRPGYFRNFYARRALRIFPLYYAAILAFVVVMPSIKFAGPIPNKVILLTASYTVNLAIAFHGWTAIPPEMQHFWTLAIEEQFYLMWPLLVYLLTRKRMVLLCAAIMAIAPLLRWWFESQQNLTAMFTFTLCRIDTLALGGLVALLTQRKAAPPVHKWILWSTGAVAAGGLLTEFIGSGGLHFGSPVMAIIGFSLVAWLSGLLIVGVTWFPGGKWARIYSSPPLRLLGKYSYGLYICHQPVMLALRIVHCDINTLRRWLPLEVVAYIAFAALSLLCSVVVALVTWHLIEAPCLKLKRFFEYAA